MKRRGPAARRGSRARQHIVELKPKHLGRATGGDDGDFWDGGSDFWGGGDSWSGGDSWDGGAGWWDGGGMSQIY